MGGRRCLRRRVVRILSALRMNLPSRASTSKPLRASLAAAGIITESPIAIGGHPWVADAWR
jgi:hypothetical protein